MAFRRLSIYLSILSQGSMDGVKQVDIIPLLKNNPLDPNVLKSFCPVSGGGGGGPTQFNSI